MQTIATTNNTLSLNRLGQYMNLYIRSWWRTLASVYGGLMLAYMGITILMLLAVGGSMYDEPQIPGWSYSLPDYSRDSFWGIEGGIAVLMGLLFGFVSGGMMFISMRNKDSRLRTLIMPASDLEKFLTVFIFYIVAPYVVFAVSLILSDLLRIAAIYAFYDFPQAAHILPWYNLPELYDLWFTSPSATAVIFCMIMSQHATFALGSIVWYRNSIIKTGVFLYILSIACSVIASLSSAVAVSAMSDHLQVYHPRFDPSETTFAVLVWVATIVSCIVTYILAYVRFKESALNFRW